MVVLRGSKCSQNSSEVLRVFLRLPDRNPKHKKVKPNTSALQTQESILQIAWVLNIKD